MPGKWAKMQMPDQGTETWTGTATATGTIRLLLLFSTHSADKAGTAPATFKHRPAMMLLFARNLRDWLRVERRGLGGSTTAGRGEMEQKQTRSRSK